MENAKKEKIKKIAGITANVLLWIFVVISMLITILVFSAQGSEDGVPALFGKSLITIETPSMEDTYSVGDLVFMSKLDDTQKAELKVNDIITYHAPIDINGDGAIGDINTHRIYEIKANGIIVTKGDNNALPDNEGDTAYTIHVNDIIGSCTEDGKLAGVGNAIKFLRSSLGFFLCIVLPLILFFLYELYNFLSIVISERAKKAALAAAAEAPAPVDEEEIKRRAIEEFLAAQKAEAAKAEEAKAEEAKAEEPVAEEAVAEEAKAEEAPVEEAKAEEAPVFEAKEN